VNAAVVLKSATDMARQAIEAAWRVLWPTRTAIALVAIFAALSFGPAQGGLARDNARKFDQPDLTHPLGGFGDTALAPLARWDAAWYLRIADSGYGGEGVRAAFFPLYPALVWVVGEAGGGSPGARLIAAYVISLAALLAALALLYRLTEVELGRELAAPALLLTSVFPGALFFGAPYSESVFLLASVGAFYAARTGRWAWAGVAAGAAAATRSAGVLLLVPLVMMWWTHGGRRAGSAAWLALGPAGLAAFALYLGLSGEDALSFLHVQDNWFRHFAGPLGGAWDGLVAGFDGARQLLSGSRSPVYFSKAAGDPFRIGALNLLLLGFLVFAVIACVGVWRRLPRAYGAYVTAALLLPLSYPVEPQPLMSLPRFLAVLFPIFMWLALVSEERRMTARVAAVSAIGLGLFTAQFASWHWIS
jgi:hypothetical protein